MLDDARLEAIRAEFERALASWGDTGSVTLDSGRRFPDGEPLLVRIRKREVRYDIDDDGIAVRKAGKPSGWRDVAERVVEEDGLNINRAGVVFVTGFERRRGDVPALAFRVAERSLAVYEALLDVAEE